MLLTLLSASLATPHASNADTGSSACSHRGPSDAGPAGSAASAGSAAAVPEGACGGDASSGPTPSPPCSKSAPACPAAPVGTAPGEEGCLCGSPSRAAVGCTRSSATAAAWVKPAPAV
eukprot:915194-Pelagomonas_calceolata.AAC.6